ncbi:MAG TPA: hypothetical protein PKY10_16240, partial [Lentisphaeria bacterium]|nr:hypothetical protein [Lentisphaeria bacterium]
ILLFVKDFLQTSAYLSPFRGSRLITPYPGRALRSPWAFMSQPSWPFAASRLWTMVLLSANFLFFGKDF